MTTPYLPKAAPNVSLHSAQPRHVQRACESRKRALRSAALSYLLRRPCWICECIGACGHRERRIVEAEAIRTVGRDG